jgi:CRISPR-associated protein Cas8a1/Csx13
VCGPSDAVLQAQLRLKLAALDPTQAIPHWFGYTFQEKPWDRQRKLRCNAAELAYDPKALDLFELALRELPPRLRQREPAEAGGQAEWLWADSRIRPLIANNLATARPWYASFGSLMSSPDNDRKTSNEQKGLHAMIENATWHDPAAETIVRAVHEAIRRRFGRIADENRDDREAMKKQWDDEYERRRRAFAGAKTADQLRFALTDLWSRAGRNEVLQQSWASVIPLLVESQWKLARDLALLGLASYAGRESSEMELTEAPTPEQGEEA